MPAAGTFTDRLLSTLDAIQEGVQVISPEWRYLYVNDAVCRHGRTAREELLGRTMMECYPGIEATDLFTDLETCMRERAPKARDNEFAYPDGSRAWFELRIQPCPEGLFVLSVDVTERRRVEERLRRVERMNAIGRLAGGVAHDFNNLLTAIKGFTTFSMETLPADGPAAADLKEVLDAAERASALTHQLLAFARAQPVSPRVVDVNAQVASLDRMVRRLLGEDIDVVTRTEEGLWRTLIDPTALEQVLVNLVVNARDAMPDGGRLTVETANAGVDEAQATRRGGVIPAGDYVVLAVSDDGVGMDAATQERIFEPFFTTKEAGKGTGLGLSTCYGIVRQAGGYIWVYSEPGKGTTFKVYLPRSVGEPEERRTVAKSSSRGDETVLVAEDDRQVRDLAVRALERAGYKALPAEDGERALAVSEGATGPIHLLVTDMVLPKVGGLELAARLAASRPGLRTMYVSGYTQAAMAHRGAIPQGAYLLAKPFTPGDLVERVREALDAPD